MIKPSYRGIAAIGDPHLASRVPGFRKDEYPTVMLRKLDWCLKYARGEGLLPCLLGDVFHWPRDNANWLLGALFELIDQPVLAICGNHDCAENTLGDDDSLSVIAKSGRLLLVDERAPWRGTMNGRAVVIGGTSWGQRLPDQFELDTFQLDGPRRAAPGLVVWLVHADVSFPGYDAGHVEPRAIPGIDLVINGHIHRPLADVVAGATTWLNPGNIARVKRGDSTRECVPSLLRIDVDEHGWRAARVEVPHEPFEQVFHAEVIAEKIATDESAFVHGLAELMARRTETGAGLREFLQQNLAQFDDRVAHEIMTLADEVLQDANH